MCPTQTLLVFKTIIFKVFQGVFFLQNFQGVYFVRVKSDSGIKPTSVQVEYPKVKKLIFFEFREDRQCSSGARLHFFFELACFCQGLRLLCCWKFENFFNLNFLRRDRLLSFLVPDPPLLRRVWLGQQWSRHSAKAFQRRRCQQPRNGPCCLCRHPEHPKALPPPPGQANAASPPPPPPGG